MKVSASSVTGEPFESTVVLLMTLILEPADLAFVRPTFAVLADEPPEPDVVWPRMRRTESISACASPASEYWLSEMLRIATREFDGATSSKTPCAAETATAFLYLRVSSAGQVNKDFDPEGLSIPGQRAASTSNRNFEGRQGRGGRTHLVSPAVAAATAVAGHFTTPEDLR